MGAFVSPFQVLCNRMEKKIVSDSVFQLELYCLGEKGQGNGEMGSGC